MSHMIGRAVTLGTRIGPDATAPTTPGVWELPVTPGPALFAIGFGAEGDLDGALLTRIARDHRGIYTRASEGLALKKFFSLAFGNIFEAGALSDPDQVLAAASPATSPTPFEVCGETRLTVVVGWSDPAQPLDLSLRTPAGATVGLGSPGVEGDRGETWRVPQGSHAVRRRAGWDLALAGRPVRPG